MRGMRGQGTSPVPDDCRSASIRLSAIVVARSGFGRIKKIRPEASVAVDFVGFGLEILGHQPQPFGARKVEATAGDAEAIVCLSAEKLGVQHGISTL
jgi:hypothetical protein